MEHIFCRFSCAHIGPITCRLRARYLGFSLQYVQNGSGYLSHTHTHTPIQSEVLSFCNGTGDVSPGLSDLNLTAAYPLEGTVIVSLWGGSDDRLKFVAKNFELMLSRVSPFLN